MAISDIIASAGDMINVHNAHIQNEITRLSCVPYKRQQPANITSPSEADIGATVQEIAFISGQLQAEQMCASSGIWSFNILKRTSLLAALRAELVTLDKQIKMQGLQTRQAA